MGLVVWTGFEGLRKRLRVTDLALVSICVCVCVCILVVMQVTVKHTHLVMQWQQRA